MDIDKEEEALRSGIERSALALKSRLEQPLMKNDSMDSTETGPSSDSASACTTQPLGKHDFSIAGTPYRIYRDGFPSFCSALTRLPLTD